jgi:hypothetical protein
MFLFRLHFLRSTFRGEQVFWRASFDSVWYTRAGSRWGRYELAKQVLLHRTSYVISLYEPIAL